MEELKNFVKNIKYAKKCTGQIKFGPTKNELKNLKYRRGIVAIKDIKKEEKFSDKNIKSMRGVSGLKPKFYFKIINKRSKKKINYGEPIKMNYCK